MYSCQFVIRFNSRGETQYSEFIKNILLSQCRGLKRVLAVVNCHFLNHLPMKTRPRQFSGSSFCSSRTFRASFARGKIIFHALFLYWFTFDALFRSAPIAQNWQLCRRHWRRNSNSWEVTASSLSFFSPPPERPGRACSLYYQSLQPL